MFNDKEKQLEKFRLKIMSDRKIICTGNPNNPYTIASGIQSLYPNATFIHKSIGWDLSNPLIYPKLKDCFSQHNTFINASYIGAGIQSTLLDLCAQSVKFCDVINIGSTHEYDGGGSIDYQESKKHLRQLSLDLNTYRFKTHHLVLGHIKNNDIKFDGESLTIKEICNTIYWLLEQKEFNFNIPLITVDNRKRPW